MSEITATRKIQHSEYEYYALIRGNITEARKANLVETLLVMSTIPKRKHKRSDIEANYRNETKTF